MRKVFHVNLHFVFSVKKAAGVRMLPLECQFLNKTALIAATGQQPQPIKHFALKRKPKSAILRAELLQKCKDCSVMLLNFNLSFKLFSKFSFNLCTLNLISMILLFGNLYIL